jgi:predicted ATPase
MPAAQTRDEFELALQVELGYAWMPLKGWAASESAHAFTRAGELSKRIGDAPKLFRALWGVAAFHFVHGDQREARHVAEQCLAIARSSDDVDALIEAYYMSGIISCAAGNFIAGRQELRECVRIHGDEARSIHRLQYAQDAKASALGWLALGLWALGEPDEALQLAHQALARVRDTSQPFLLARGLAAVGFVHVLRREAQGPHSPLAEAIDLCVEQGYTYFHAILSAFAGMNLVHVGRTEEGIAQINSSIRQLRAIGSELLLTVIFANLAQAHLALGQVDSGLTAVADGLDCVERNGEHWGEAELYRMRGALMLLPPNADMLGVEACFTKALDIACAQRANTYRLRAAMSLAQLWLRQDRKVDADHVLCEAIATWPAQTDSVDLREAQALRQQLS